MFTGPQEAARRQNGSETREICLKSRRHDDNGVDIGKDLFYHQTDRGLYGGGKMARNKYPGETVKLILDTAEKCSWKRDMTRRPYRT